MKKTKTGIGDKAFDQVQQFYKFMNTNKLETIEFSKDDVYIKLVRKSSAPLQSQVIPVFAPGVDQRQPNQQAAPSKTPAIQETRPEGQTIKAPLAGIFYRAPSPSTPPYIREGDMAQKGQILCIIEAMKVFNEIKCEQDCQIIKVLADNGRPIEPDQDIFIVKNK
ncbi:MAG: biotin/lipoyl-containing protein [Elusimicrobiota bacterium]|nr:biotin/lipoyl-containing protein [Elusimicrobiota bacterium]